MTCEPIEVTQTAVSCDGGLLDGNVVLGHPKVYLHLDDTDQITCPYCSRHFVLSASGAADHSH